MRQFRTATLVACVVLLATSGVANASSHGAMSAGLSFTDMVVWEVQHYLIHMHLTLEAIRTWFVSPELGWALLDGQTLCVEQGHLTAHLFDTGMHALVSFFSILVVLAWFGVEVAARLLHFLIKRLQQPSRAIA